MEKAVGVISEFNPFHKGHAYFLGEIKKHFPQKPVVCLMSGNFVQRGSFAVQEKYSRAKCALLSGADLVLEFPFPFSSLSAESFAASGVSVLKRLSVIDTLAFGCECADVKALQRISDNLSSDAFRAAFEAYSKGNKAVGYPAARSRVYGELFGDTELLNLPNAILALEYLRAIREEKASLSPFAVARVGDGLRDDEAFGTYASATAVRKLILDGKDPSEHLPSVTLAAMEEDGRKGTFPVSMEYYASTVFYLLRTKSPKELSLIYGLGAFADRAKKVAPSCASLEELVEKLGSPTLTHSRIRRALLSLLCQTLRYAEKETPSFTMVLGANEKGRELLGEMNKISEIPVFTKPAHALKSTDKTVLRQSSALFLADDLYAAAFPKKGENGEFLKKTPYII